MTEEEPKKKKKRGRRRWSFMINARGWIFLVLTVSVAFAAGFKGNNLLFAIFCVLLGVFVTCGALTFAVGRGMRVSRILPESLYAGELFTVGLRIKNGKKIWPAFCLRFEDRLSHDGRPATLQPTPVWLPFSGPGKRVRGSYYLTAHQRGWAKLGPLVLTSEFTPGLFTYRLVLPVEDPILVYPRVGILNKRLMNPHLSRVESGELVSGAFTRGEEEFAGLREYRPGDNPRRIHWKMSARIRGRLLVQEHEDPRVRDAVILLETFVPNPNDQRRRMRLERAITFVATLAEGLIADRYTVRFRAFAPDLLEVRLEPGREAMPDLLYALAELRPTRVRQLGELMASEDGGKEEIFLLLRIGDEPLPSWEPIRRAVVIDAGEMKNLMYTTS